MPEWFYQLLSAFVGGVAGGWIVHKIDTERWRSFLWHLHDTKTGKSVWWGGQQWFEQQCPTCGEIGLHECRSTREEPTPWEHG